MATITKRDQYSWQAKIRRKGFPSKSRTFYTKDEAEKWARSIEHDMDRHCFTDTSEAERYTFGEVLERYRREVTPLHKGHRNEVILINQLLQYDIAKLKMTAISSKVIAELKAKRLREVSSGTVNRMLDLISSVINTARKDWGLHINNPVELIKRPPKSKSRDRRLDPNEEHRLLAALEETSRNEDGTFRPGARNIWLKPIVEFAIETAMRRGELLALKWKDVDLKLRVAKLYDTKNGEDRDVPLSSKAVNILKNIPHHIHDTIFPVSPNALKKGFERACKRAGIEDLRFHDLRHEGASRLADKLSNVLELSAVTGHRDLRMLQRYYHPRASDLAKKLA